MRSSPSERLSPGRRFLVRGAILAAVGLLAAGGLYVLAVEPPGEASYYPRCQFHQLTGLHCPGCGMTRAAHAALNGQFSQALAYNLLAPVFLPVVAVSILWSLWSWAWGGTDRRPTRRPGRWTKWTPWVFFGVLLTFWVLRNLPVYPFTLLAPHELTP